MDIDNGVHQGDDTISDAFIQAGVDAANAGRVTPWRDVRAWMLTWFTQDDAVPA